MKTGMITPHGSGTRNRHMTRPPLIMALEPRIMFDGAAVADATHAAVDAVAKAPVPEMAVPVVVREADPKADPTGDNGKKEVAFIDANVADRDALVTGIRDGVEVVVLEGSRDGLAQMAEWAETHSGYDAIHVLSHGTEGAVRLGSLRLDTAAVAERAADLATLGTALTAEGDLMLYGCSVAAGETGQAFIANLAAATGADVAASNDATGSADKGGDWVLELQIGQTDSARLAEADTIQSWDSILATYDFAGATSNPDGTATTADDFFIIDRNMTESVSADAYGAFINLNGANPGSTYTAYLEIRTKTTGSFQFTSAVIGEYQELNSVPFTNFSNVRVIGYANGQAVGETTPVSSTDAYETSYAIDYSPISGKTIDKLRVYFDVESGSVTATFNLASLDISNQSSNPAPLPGPTATNDTAAATEAGGVNDGTASTNPTGDVLANDTGATSVDSFRTDSTEGQGTAGILGQALTGTYGSLNLAGNGSYTYTVDNANGSVAALAAGSTLHDTFNYTAWNGSSGNDGVLDVTITGVNDAPAIGGAVTTTGLNDNAGATSIFSGVTIADADTGESDLTVEIRLSDATAGTIGGGQGFTETSSGSGIWRITGKTAAQAQAAVQAATFIPANNTGASGTFSTTFTIAVNDQSAAEVTSTSGSLTVTRVNDVPAASGVPASVTVTEDTLSNVDLSAITLSDPDTASITVTITAGAGTLTASSGGGVTVGGSGAGTLTLSGSATDIDTFLNTASNIKYTGANNANGTAATTLIISADDGSGSTSLGTVNVNITAVNDAPTASGTYTFTGTSEDAATTGVQVSTITGGVTAGDVDGNTLGIAVTATVGNGVWQFSHDSTNGGDGTWTAFNATQTPSAANSLLLTQNAWVRYVPDNNNGETATFSFRAWDQTSGTASSGTTARYADTQTNGNATAYSGGSTASASATVSSVNDAPVNTKPITQNTNEDTPLVFSSGNGNALSVADVDTGQTLTTVVSVASGTGTLSVTTGGGGAITGDGTNSVQIVGTVTQVQNALSSVTYTPTANASGAGYATLTLQTTDNGTGTLSDTDTVIIDVTAQNDVPTIATLNGDSASFVVGGTAVNIDSGTAAAVADVDSSTFNGGYLTITNTSGTNNGSFSVDGTTVTSGGDGTIAGSEAVAVGGTTIGTVHAANDGQGGNALRIEFNSEATPARVATLLQNIRYVAPTGLGARGFNVVVNDGAGSSTAAAFTITGTPNPPVIADLGGDSATFTEDGSAVLLDQATAMTTASVTDADSANFNGGFVTVSITANKVNAEDVLAIRTGSGVTLGSGMAEGSAVIVDGVTIGGIEDGGTGSGGSNLVVSLTSNATPSRVATLLANLTYANGNTSNPSTLTRTIQISVTDAFSNYGTGTATVTVGVNGANDAPALADQAHALSAIDEDLASGSNTGTTVASIVVNGSVTDPDGSAVEAIAVTAVDTTNGAWQYKVGSGAWTAFDFTGANAGKALLLDATDSVRFLPNAEWNGTVSSGLTFHAWDKTSGSAGSYLTVTGNTGGANTLSTATDTASIAVSAVNDAPTPTNTGGTTATVTEGSGTGDYSTAAYVLSQFDVSDNDAPANFLNGVLTVTIDANDRQTNDYLWVQNGVNNVTIATNTVSYNGGAVATAAFVNGVLTLTFDQGTPTEAAVEAVARSVVFYNTGNDDPTVKGAKTTRSITSTFADGGNTGSGGAGTSNTLTTTVTVTAVDDQPSITATPNVTFTESGTGGAAVAPLSGITLADADGTHMNGGSLVVSLDAYRSGDVLSVVDGNDISVSGTTVSYASNAIGTLSGGSGATLTISFNSANATVAAVQALMGQVRFANTGNDPTVKGADPHRVATFTLDDGGNTGTASTAASTTSTITVTGENDTPTVTVGGATATFSPGTPVAIDTGLVLDDVDSANLVRAVVEITNVQDGAAESLGLTSAAQTAATTAGMTVTAYNRTTHQLVITKAGGATVAEWQAVLRGVTYDSSVSPTTGTTRAITFQVRDDSGDAATYQNTPPSKTLNLNLPPTIAANTGPTVDEGSSATVITNAMLRVQDVETTNAASLTYTVTTAPARGTLYRNGVALAQGGTFTQDDIDNSLITYTHDGGETTSDTIGFSYSDGTNTVTGGSFAVTVTPVNDAPVLDLAAPALTPITEDTLSPSGDTVASLVGATITDADTGAVKGIAITAATPGNGTWQYSLDGSTWTAFVAVSPNAALLLRSTDRVRLVPDGRNETSGTFTYAAWDRTTGTAGATAAVTTGAASAFSGTSNTATITVSAVNDAPTVLSTPSPGAFTDRVAYTLPAGTFADVDIGDTRTYTATSLPSWLSFSGGTFSGTPPYGSHSVPVTVTAADGHGGTASVAFTIGATRAAPPPPPPPPPPPEPPKVEPKPPPEPPKDPPKIEAPIIEAPKIEAPKTETKVETPPAQSGAQAAPGPVATIPAALTAPAPQAFQVAVTAAPVGGGDALVVNAPVKDAVVAEGTRIAVTIPADSFAHTKADATVTLTAQRVDGAALPAWMNFNPQTGTFEGTPPPGFKGEVAVKVIARDSDGREAVQTFRIVVGQAGTGTVAPDGPGGEGQPQGEGAPPEGGPRSGDPVPGRQAMVAKPVGRPSLTEQLRAMGREGQKARQQAFVDLLRGKGRAA